MALGDAVQHASTNVMAGASAYETTDASAMLAGG
jgi:hypothetical protein